MNNYRQAALLDLLNNLLKGYGNRYGDLLGKLIKAGFDPKNPLLWLDFLDTANDICFFGNASITALDAIKKDVCSFTTPCKVEGLTYNTDVFRNMRTRYEELMDFSYTLKMSVQTASIPHKEKQSDQIKIERDGTYNDFNFDFKELQTLYDYEPSLTLDITVKKYLSPQQLKELKNAVLSINPDATFDDITEPIWYTINKNCTIYGSPKSLVTGSVSSKVEKVKNVKATTADVICSFSKVPSGAECIVSVTREGSDIALTYSGTPGINSQTVKATSLSPNTKYVATTYITYNGRVYDGTNSVEFTTSGPSGNVILIDSSTITTSSAVAKCIFSGMDSSVECGVIAQSGSQTLTYKASSIDGEQNVPLTGLNPSTEYICYAYVKMYGYYKQQDNGVSFTTKGRNLCPDENHPHAIDLGLPSGTKWCCCNLGASKPEDYGGFYTLNEAQQIGEQWQVPTYDQMYELFEGLNWASWRSFEKYNGVNGYYMKSRNNNEIFIPAAGYIDGHTADKEGHYWTCTLYPYSPKDDPWAYFWYFRDGHMDYGNSPFYGYLSVRPVCQ